MTALAKHEWTGCQLTNLLEALLSDETAAKALLRLRPGAGFRADTIPIPEDEDPANMLHGDERLEQIRRMKEYYEKMRRYYEQKYALQFLQGTKWIQDAEAAGWIVRTPKGFTPTEKFGESPVAVKMVELEMEHIKICTRIGEAESPSELAPHQKAIWRQIKASRGSYGWYFPYHRLFRRYRPSGVPATTAATSPATRVTTLPADAAARPVPTPRTRTSSSQGKPDAPPQRDAPSASAARRASSSFYPTASSVVDSAVVAPSTSMRKSPQVGEDTTNAPTSSNPSHTTRMAGNSSVNQEPTSVASPADARHSDHQAAEDADVRVSKRPRVSASPRSHTPSASGPGYGAVRQASVGPGSSTLAHRLSRTAERTNSDEIAAMHNESPDLVVDDSLMGSRQGSALAGQDDNSHHRGYHDPIPGLQMRIGSGAPTAADAHDDTNRFKSLPVSSSSTINSLRPIDSISKLADRIAGTHTPIKGADAPRHSSDLASRLSRPAIFETIIVDTDSDSDIDHLSETNKSPDRARPHDEEQRGTGSATGACGNADSISEDDDDDDIVFDAARSANTAPIALLRQPLSSRISSNPSNPHLVSVQSTSAYIHPVDPEEMSRTLSDILNPRRRVREERNRTGTDAWDSVRLQGSGDDTPFSSSGLAMSRTGSVAGSARSRPYFSVNPSRHADRSSRCASHGRDARETGAGQGGAGEYDLDSSRAGTDTDTSEDEDNSAPDDVIVTPSSERGLGTPFSTGSLHGDAPIARGKNVLGFSFGPSNKPRTSKGVDRAEAQARAEAQEGEGRARRREPLMLHMAGEEGSISPEVRYRGIVIDDGTLDDDDHPVVGEEDDGEEGERQAFDRVHNTTLTEEHAQGLDMLDEEDDVPQTTGGSPPRRTAHLQATSSGANTVQRPCSESSLTEANMRIHDKDKAYNGAGNDMHNIIMIDDDDEGDGDVDDDDDDWIMDLRRIAQEDDLDGFMAALDKVSRDVDM